MTGSRCECGQYPDVCRRYGHASGYEPMSDAEWKPFAAALGIEPHGTCPLCNEPVMDDDISPGPLYTPEGPQAVHRTCMLREVIGGIGHLVAHDYWCGEPRHDPDAGLTRRQSALLVDLYVHLVGIEEIT